MTTGASSLRIAWWNCGLSPRGRKSKQPELPTTRQRHLASQVVSDLLLAHAIDILVVGEIDPSEAELMKAAIAPPRRLSVDDESETGVVVFYDGEAVELATHRTLVISYGKKELRRIRQLGFDVKDSEFGFRMFACHWPSRMRGDQARRERDALAIELKRHIGHLEVSPGRKPVIAIGDFNDEPFDASLSQHLGGSRNREVVTRNTGNLYNPYWRQLGERDPHPPQSNPLLAAGTHHFGSDPSTRWLTFDQALLSHDFLQSEGWTLDESATGIIQQSPLLIAGRRRIHPDFDHFPILVSLSNLAPPTSGAVS